MHATFFLSTPNGLSNVWEPIYTTEKTLDDRKKAEMQKGFGRTVDHCDKSMTERMTEIL